MLLALAPVAQPVQSTGRLTGQGLSRIARSGAAVRRCVWIERRALKHGAR
jgi:hypothetical protein